MKPLPKLPAALALFFAIAAHAQTDESVQTMGFTEVNQGMPFITTKAVPPVATSDASPKFRLDLHFGTDTQPVLVIAPLIHYNSSKLEIVAISNIATARLLMPQHSDLSGGKMDPLTITIAGQLVVADTDTALLLTWLDMDEIVSVADATVAAPVRMVTITFQWKAGATGDSHIAITQDPFGVADVFSGASIVVQSPRFREFSLDVDASGSPANQADGIMISRYFLGVRGDALTKDLSNANADDVAAAIESGLGALDVDASGGPANSSDAIMVSRYFLGVEGAALTKGLSSADPAKVKSAIEALL